MRKEFEALYKISDPADISCIDRQGHKHDMAQLEDFTGYELLTENGVFTILYSGSGSYISKCGLKIDFGNRSVNPKLLHLIEHLAYAHGLKSFTKSEKCRLKLLKQQSW